MKRQQGDVIIRSAEIPKGAKRIHKKEGRYALAVGEATGHAHVIEDDIKMYDKDGIIYIKASKPVTVRHEEHKPILLNKGTYRVGIVREYDPFTEEVKKVED